MTRESDYGLLMRPMPDPTTERCPGSGQAGTVHFNGWMVVCPECGQKAGVYPPFFTTEHERPTP
jgi:hypothetical protein